MKELYPILICAAISASSCMTQKKWAQGCAERFPVKESTVYVHGETRYDTAYLPGDTLVFSDTVTVDCDTVKGVITKYVYKERLCPPPAIVTKHQLDTLIITKVDSAAVRVAQIEAQEQRQRADRVTGGRDTWRWIAIACLLMIGAAIFSKLKGFI